MTTGRKRWWRLAAIAAVSGCVVTGGWYGFVRATAPAGSAEPEAVNWSRSATPPPAVAEVGRSQESAPPTGPVTQASGTLPIPDSGSSPVVPAVPVAPAPPSIPIPLPPVEPAGKPMLPQAGDKSAIPAVPAIPPAELPPLPVAPNAPDMKPGDSGPKPPALPLIPPVPASGAFPPQPVLPMDTAEPPKAVAPAMPMIPQPPGITPPLPPVQPAVPVQPMLPAKSDSDLKPNKPGNTLNPVVPPIAPLPPIGGTGRETPGTTVERPKPPEPNLGSTDKFVFPVPNPIAPPLRDDTMMKLTTSAAFAVLGGALLAAEQANAFPTIPPSAVIPMPAGMVNADEKMDIDKLKTDLAAANKKIEELEKQVKKLTELLTGKRDDVGLPVPSDPGAVEEVKRLKDKITKLEDEIKSLKTQTALKPTVTPEVKPKGTVKVINEYPVEISIVINDKSYRVAPNKVLDVEVPAGDFSYQLLQSGAPATKSVIRDKETVRLRIK